VTGDYRFQGEDGPTDFAGLFAGKPTLAAYSYMFGPHRGRPCPMCTNLLGAWESNAADIGQRISLVVVARSPIERLIAWKRERGWKNLRLYSGHNDAYSRDYFGVSSDGSEIPAFNVFTRRRYSPSLLVRRDDQLHRRPRPGPKGRTSPGSAVDGPGLHAGRARQGLVSEARLRRLTTISSICPYFRELKPTHGETKCAADRTTRHVIDGA
jgi:predicted dithiol-disulfide oxidoreductase (DUF899 family)